MSQPMVSIVTDRRKKPQVHASIANRSIQLGREHQTREHALRACEEARYRRLIDLSIQGIP